MRNLATFRNRDRSVFHAGRSTLLAATLAGTMILAPATMAQDSTPDPSPVASPAATSEAESTILMQEQFDKFVPAPMTMRMLRITIEPGGSTPMHTHPGPEFDLIEQGDLTIRTEGDATITRENGDTEAATEEEQTLAPGDWIVYPTGTGMFYENTTDENVVLLSSVLLPVGSDYPESITYTDGQPTSKDFEGVTFKVLGDGLVQQMPQGSATVTISRETLPASADLPANDGVAMYSQEKGNFSFIVDSGAVQVSRSKLQSLQPNAVTGEEFILEQGDAAFFPAGVEATSRADESGMLEILVISVDFEEPIDREAASLTFTSGSSATGDATGGAEADSVTDDEDNGETSGIIGSIVTTNVNELNLRAEPNTEAEVVDQLASGIEVEIIGGPQEGESYTWYEVQITTQGGNSGWLASDFLDGLDDAIAESETPSPTETAEATSAPESESADAFATGDVVVTTEDGVRIRDAGNLGGDIVDAFSTGTQYEVTGDPVEADGYTWYPVTLVENPEISGWVPAGFLAPQE